MSCNQVCIRELAGWGLDSYEYRTQVIDPAKLRTISSLVQERPAFQQPSVVLEEETAQLRDALSLYSDRADLLQEMSGLSWTLGIVDLRPLIAFQRRLSFDPEVQQVPIPSAQNWPALLDLSFGLAKPVVCEVVHEASTHTMFVRSANPNLHFRVTNDATLPLNIHPGGPFFEVACLRGRWFLRDGYHRAYALLRHGVFEVPALIIQAATIEELGATQPWFFSEEILFSKTPPYVLDFLEDNFVLEYTRPRLIKTLRITMEEALTPAPPTGEPS